MKKNLFLSFIDQGIVSLSNFLLIIFLARILDKAEFGFISFLLFISVLINNTHISLITQPHNVIAAKLGQRYYEKYTSGLLGLNILFIILLILMSLLIYFLHYLQLINLYDETAFIIFSLFYLTIKQLQDFFRRILFTSGHIQELLISDIIAYGGVILFIWLAYYFNITLLHTIIILISIPYILSTIYLLQKNRIEYKLNLKIMVMAYKKSYNFARWAFLSTFTSWVGTRIFPITLGILVNMETVAVYAVLMNIINTLNPFFYTLTNFLTTVFAKMQQKSNVLKQTFNVFLASLPIVIIAITILFIYAEDILFFLYGPKYTEYAELLKYISSSILLIGIANILQLYLRALQQVKYIFQAFLFSSFFTLTIGTYLIHSYQIEGAVLAFVLSWAVSDIFLGFSVLRMHKVKM
ncbi:oligosaccharide flippase family protein [Sulfurimonas sp. HSL3-7]|uniref:lipopolysaccharide biosynthesis protein n=1 Tax=Sulfonitrofixus jiaomeiensis TaxID=3131938 RepID=UPI0031F97BBE